MSDNTFTSLSRERIADIIIEGNDHLIFAAPSISKIEADAICRFRWQAHRARMRVIIDPTAERFRDGFGEVESLRDMIGEGVEIRKAPGLRIGVLVVDHEAWVYSPTPEVIFDQPDEFTFNAVKVTAEFAEQIIAAIAPTMPRFTDELQTPFPELEEIYNDYYEGQFGPQPKTLDSSIIVDESAQEIGHEVLALDEIDFVELELEIAPPQQFDLSRQVNVYSAYYQFVEIHLSNCNLSAFTIPISDQLLSIVDDQEVSRRLSAKYKLVEADSKIKKDLKGITDSVNDLRSEFTISISAKTGRIIAKERKAVFEEQAREIQNWIQKVTREIENDLKSEIEANCSRLAQVLVPIVVEKQPGYLRNRMRGDFSDSNRISDVIVAELMPSDTVIKNLVDGMRLEFAYKDITYEMLNDEEFVSKIKSINPDRKDLFEEGPALKAKKQAQEK